MRRPHICRPWTTEEDGYLRETYWRMTGSQIGKVLNRTRNSVIGRAHVLGLYRKRGAVIQGARPGIPSLPRLKFMDGPNV